MYGVVNYFNLLMFHTKQLTFLATFSCGKKRQDVHAHDISFKKLKTCRFDTMLLLQIFSLK